MHLVWTLLKEISNLAKMISEFQEPNFRDEKSAQRPKFSAGRPCGHPAKNFGQALEILEKQAFRHGHAARTSTKKLRSEKLRADFSFPTIATGNQNRWNRSSRNQNQKRNIPNRFPGTMPDCQLCAVAQKQSIRQKDSRKRSLPPLTVPGANRT